ncbi:MAG: DUF503 domain-containing protein [Deltaproteobacteria bacterium]|nr:DUF503 domain-containing protein [Deltaproteobacteria bacterium]
MVVGVLQLDLHLPGRHSLKEKRQALRRIKDRVAHHFRFPIAEVGHQELWQRAVLGCALAGSDDQDVRGLLTQVARFIEGLHVGDVVRSVVDVTHHETPTL